VNKIKTLILKPLFSCHNSEGIHYTSILEIYLCPCS